MATSRPSGPVVHAGLGGLLGDETREHGTGIEERRAGRGRDRAHDAGAAERSGASLTSVRQKAASCSRRHGVRASTVANAVQAPEGTGCSHRQMRRIFEAESESRPLEPVVSDGPRPCTGTCVVAYARCADAHEYQNRRMQVRQSARSIRIGAMALAMLFTSGAVSDGPGHDRLGRRNGQGRARRGDSRRDRDAHQRNQGDVAHARRSRTRPETSSFRSPRWTPTPLKSRCRPSRPSKQSGVAVSPGSRTALGTLILEVGGTTETVEVKAESTADPVHERRTLVYRAHRLGPEPAVRQPRLHVPRLAGARRRGHDRDAGAGHTAVHVEQHRDGRRFDDGYRQQRCGLVQHEHGVDCRGQGPRVRAIRPNTGCGAACR